MEGLRAGVYTLGAEDDDGLYFIGKDACVIKLGGDNGDDFLRTGQSRVGFLPGGLWLPRKGVSEDPRLFYLFSGEPSGATGASVGAIIASGRGDVIFVDYGREKEFVKGLRISDR